MRLWHKSLIESLPREQLVAQWRELSAIAGSIQMKGSPNHILVNKVMDYSFDHFITYAAAIRAEMTRRGYRTMNSVWEKIIGINGGTYNRIPFDELYKEWMNREYLIICYYNLKEKWLCGGIGDADWARINSICEVINDK